MSCNSAEKLFDRALDGDLAAHERVRVFAHVESCDACRAVLEELRVIDALLLQPRRIELAPNFTFATMAEARSLPPPRRPTFPARAYLVSYLSGAWLLAGAAWVFAPDAAHAVAGTSLDLARATLDVIGGVSSATNDVLGHGAGPVPAVFGTLLALDATLVFAVAVALRRRRQRIAGQSRS